MNSPINKVDPAAFVPKEIWDAWMLIWVSFGLVLGVSSLVVGWRRLKQTFFPKKKAVRSKKTEVRKPVSTSPRYL